MHKSIRTVLVVFLAVGLMASFAAPAAAQEVSNEATATVDQDQTNEQYSVQNAEVKGDMNTVTQTNVQVSDQTQEGTAGAAAVQGISITVDIGGEGDLVTA